MKVLVTGAAGFIGMHVALRLLERGDNVVGLDNMNDYYDVDLKKARLARLTLHPNFEFRELDISDRQAVSDLFDQCKPDRVVHLAAQAGVRYSLENPHAYIDANIQGFMNILEGCRQHPVEHLVYASSSSVYGKTEKIPIKEDEPKNPINPYGKTKVEKDNLAERYSKERCSIIGLRYFNVFGKGQTGTYAGVITKFLECLKNKTSPIIYGDGKQVRDFVSVEDIASANLQAMLSDTKNGFFNIGTGVPTTILELAKIMIKISNKNIKPIFEESRKGDVKLSQADLLNTQKYLDWHSEIKLEEGLKKLMKKIS